MPRTARVKGGSLIAALATTIQVAGYPLIVEDRLIGVLGLFARHSLGQDTVNALASVAATIAIAIERKRSEESLLTQAVELRRSNEDLEQFAHVASHDLRSPLNTILQFTEMIVRKQGASVDAEMGQLLEIVRKSAGRMGDLISALLTYSRLNDASSRVVRPISSLTAYEILDFTCSPTLLTPEAFNAFLPAYLLRALYDLDRHRRADHETRENSTRHPHPAIDARSRFASIRLRPAHREYKRTKPLPGKWLLIE